MCGREKKNYGADLSTLFRRKKSPVPPGDFWAGELSAGVRVD
jgi:hypothetical protein